MTSHSATTGANLLSEGKIRVKRKTVDSMVVLVQ